MAVYQPKLNEQLLTRLENEEETLCERFKLAEFLFISPTIPVMRKEEIILEWLSNTIVKLTEPESLNSAFNTLATCVKSQRFQNLSNGISQNVFDAVLKALFCISNLEDDTVKGCGNECILTILEAVPFQNKFCRDVANMSDVIKTYCSTSSGDDNPQLLFRIIHVLDNISKLCLLKNELRLLFVNDLLLPLCRVICKLESKREECFQELLTCFIQIVFREASFTDLFLQFYPVKNISEENIFISSVISFIKKLPKTENCGVVESCYLLFLKAFLSKNTDNHSQIFKVFICLCRALGVKVKGMISIELKPKKNWSKENTFSVMYKMIQLLDESQLSIDCNIDEDTSINVWLTSMIIGLTNINCGELSVPLLKLLQSVLRFNPLIIEPCHGPLTMVIFEIKDNEEVLNEYCNLFKCIIDGCVKVTRFQKFISKFLDNIAESFQFGSNKNLTVQQIIPDEITDHFSQAAANLPSFQVLSLAKALHFHLLFHLRNMEQWGAGYDHDVLIKTEVVVQLLTLFINGVKIADFNTPIVVKDKFSSIIGDIEECLAKFSDIILDRENNDRIMVIFLKLCQAVGCFTLFTWEYDRERNVPLKLEDNCSTNLSYIHSYVDPLKWELIEKRISINDNYQVKSLYYSLMIQKMVAVSQVEEGCEGPGTQVARYLLEHAPTKWLWENATTFAPLLQDNELLGLVEEFTKSAGRDHTRWLPFISSDSFLQDKRLVVATSISILTLVAKHIHKNRKNGAVSHRVMSKVAVVPLLEYELSRLYEENTELEVELRCFFEEMVSELEAYLLEAPPPAPSNEDYSIAGYIEIISKMPYEDCSYPMEACVLIAIIALLCDIPINTNKDILLLNKLNLFLEVPLSSRPSCLFVLHSGALLKFLIKRTEFFPNQKLLIERFCIFSVNNEYTSHLLIKYVKSPTAATLWQTTCVIKALSKFNKKKNSDSSKDEKEESHVVKSISKLVHVSTHVLLKEEPSVELLKDYTIVLKHILGSQEDDNTNARGLLINLDQFLNLATLNFSVGRSLLKFVLKRMDSLSQHIPKEFLMHLWTRSLFKSDERNKDFLENFFSAVSVEQLRTILEDLYNLLEISVNEVPMNSAGIKRCFFLWEALLSCEATHDKAQLRSGALTPLVKPLSTLVSQWKDQEEPIVLPVLNFFSALFYQFSVIIANQVLDNIIITLDCVPLQSNSCFPYLKGGFDVLLSLFSFRKYLLQDRLPVYLQRYNSYSEALAKLTSPLTDESCHPVAITCAIKLQKIAQNMIKNKKGIARIAPYIISDFLRIFQIYTINSEIKVYFIDALNEFFSIIDEHSINYLASALNPTSQELFKKYYDQYNKYYRYEGKI